jgi:seryl-tRNA synthetase
MVLIYTALIKPHLDYKFYRDNVEMLQTNAKLRGVEVDVKSVGDLYTKHCELLSQLNKLNQKRNEISRDRTKIEEGKNIRIIVDKLENELDEVSLLFTGISYLLFLHRSIERCRMKH